MNKAHPPPARRRRFLTAEWRHLAMLNYPIDPAALEPFVPAGTTVDTYKGVAYVSIVGFLFLRTRVMGVPVPWHRDFEEVNLRFYVRRLAGDEWRRGVVFIREIVPKAVIAAVARTIYNEQYLALPMRHRVEWHPGSGENTGVPATVEYRWLVDERWHHVRAASRHPARASTPGSLEEFITEHYWGYVRQRDGSTVEYEVEHPRWNVAPADPASAELNCDAARLYGECFAATLQSPPKSAFIADGSPVTVYRGTRLPWKSGRPG